MSVTFAVEFKSVVGYDVVCDCGVKRASFDDYDSAIKYVSIFRAVPFALSGCSYGDACVNIHVSLVTDVSGTPELNVNNSNAGRLLNLVGITEFDELSGSMNADRFYTLAREAYAVAVTDYDNERLYALLDVAAAAKEMNRAIVWA